MISISNDGMSRAWTLRSSRFTRQRERWAAQVNGSELCWQNSGQAVIVASTSDTIESVAGAAAGANARQAQTELGVEFDESTGSAFYEHPKSERSHYLER